MAGRPRFVGPLVVLLLLVSPAQPSPYSDNLQDACNKTLFPKVCIQSLTTNPETRTADARRLAELSVYAAKEVGTTVAAFAHKELNGLKDDVLFKCLDSCSTDIEETVAHLSALTRELTDSKFLEVKSWLSATLGGSSTCEEGCKAAPASDAKNAVVTKSVEFEKLLRVTLDLITEASGSMSASGSTSGDVAVPPTAWDGSASGSYGASAPDSYSASAPESSESASAPESSESASAPGSEAPSADASAPSSASTSQAPSADAPGTSSSSAPSSEAPSSDAPAPSNAPSSDAPSADAPGSYGSGAPSSEAPSSDAPAPSKAASSDAPSAAAPGTSYGSASGPASDAPSPSPSDADAPSSGSADAPSSGAAGAPSYGAAGAPSPSDAGAPDADSPA